MKLIEHMLAALLVAGGAKVLYGAAAIAAQPAAFVARNAAHIPTWIPGALAVALLACALCTYRRELVFVALAAFWGLAAGAFARPAIGSAGWPDPPIEWAAVPLALALLLAATSRALPDVVRRAAGFAVAAGVLPFAVDAATGGRSTPGLDAIVYTTVAVLAIACASTAQKLRRQPCPPPTQPSPRKMPLTSSTLRSVPRST